MSTGSELEPFVLALSEWVEACWFAEQEAADTRLQAVLAFPPDVVLVGSLTVLGRLLQRFRAGPDGDLAGALAEHLIIAGPDPEREQLIGDVVRSANAAPSVRAAMLDRHGSEAVTGAALECASLLAQAMANRDGVVPSSILLDD